jgi:YesN/AraC family two-component response regulator
LSTFLIVEDDTLHRNFLREVIALAEIGCSALIEADDGDAAIRLAHGNDIKGVIMDLQMPNRTGVHAARALWSETPT